MITEKHNLIEVIEFCRANHLPADVVGRWVWIRFNEKPGQEVRDLLKSFGFQWIQKRGQWAHNCGHYSRAGQGDPRFKYGEVSVDEYQSIAV